VTAVRITLNGRSHEVPPGATVAGLLEGLGLPAVRLAVERNGRVVPKPDYPAVALEEGDVVEVVHFVGGG
jgi:thiamine biosynthesis protein ThiS